MTGGRGGTGRTGKLGRTGRTGGKGGLDRIKMFEGLQRFSQPCSAGL